MENYLYFALSVLTFAAGVILVVFKDLGRARHYLKANPKVWGGILWFVGAALGIVAAWVILVPKAQADWRDTDKGRFFSYGGLFLGIDRTSSPSPFCTEGGPNDRATSNGGLLLNLFQSKDKTFFIDSVYTHHSCAFNGDTAHYDAFGIRSTIYLWN